ncbi:MAG: acyltransferase domain-containing protein [Caldilineaceae bacterium]
MIEQLDLRWLPLTLAPVFTSGQTSAAPVKLAFVYAGMGAQWWAMGRRLFQEEPIFRNVILEIDRLFQPLAGWSLIRDVAG